MSVEIVSDPENQRGRPVFAGTRIPIGGVRNYALTHGVIQTVLDWGHGLTAEMAEAAMAYEFPPVVPAALDVDACSFRCSCGEPAYFSEAYDDDPVIPKKITCPCCRKTFVITITVEETPRNG